MNVQASPGVAPVPPSGLADPEAERLRLLHAIERKLLWLSAWMIHHANHIRPNRDGLKVGGHQASCASCISIMTALYFEVMRPQDRLAVKPHAGPVFHAINYLFGRQQREKLETLRQFRGIQPYPSRTKDGAEVDFSTGSVGLGVALTNHAFAHIPAHVDDISLWVIAANDRARKFYERIGFTLDGIDQYTQIGDRAVYEVRYVRPSS